MRGLSLAADCLLDALVGVHQRAHRLALVLQQRSDEAIRGDQVFVIDRGYQCIVGIAVEFIDIDGDRDAGRDGGDCLAGTEEIPDATGYGDIEDAVGGDSADLDVGEFRRIEGDQEKIIRLDDGHETAVFRIRHRHPAHHIALAGAQTIELDFEFHVFLVHDLRIPAETRKRVLQEAERQAGSRPLFVGRNDEGVGHRFVVVEDRP